MDTQAGRLPLHFACAAPSFGPEAVGKLLQGFPDGAKTPDNVRCCCFGMRMRCARPASLVFRADCGAMQSGALPLHCAAARPHPDTEVMRIVLDAFPGAAAISNAVRSGYRFRGFVVRALSGLHVGAFAGWGHAVAPACRPSTIISLERVLSVASSGESEGCPSEKQGVQLWSFRACCARHACSPRTDFAPGSLIATFGVLRVDGAVAAAHCCRLR